MPIGNHFNITSRFNKRVVCLQVWLHPLHSCIQIGAIQWSRSSGEVWIGAKSESIRNEYLGRFGGRKGNGYEEASTARSVCLLQLARRGQKTFVAKIPSRLARRVGWENCFWRVVLYCALCVGVSHSHRCGILLLTLTICWWKSCCTQNEFLRNVLPCVSHLTANWKRM